jgi:hypothetical protein
MMDGCNLFTQGVAYHKAVRQANGLAEEGLIISSKAHFIGLQTGIIIDCGDPSVAIGEEISPQAALALIEQCRQEGYRQVDRQLTAIKKIAMLF